MHTVFISYSHGEGATHLRRVRALSDRLRRHGVDAVLDQYVEAPPVGWTLWMTARIRDARFVLMVCTASYYARVMGEERLNGGEGVPWEGELIRVEYSESKMRSDKFIPVLFDEKDRRWIPAYFRGVSRYTVDSDKGFRRLVARVRSPSSGGSSQERIKGLSIPTGGWTRRPLGALIRVPLVPRAIIRRPTAESGIVRNLLSKGPRVGLHGMTGVGKSTFAAAVCNDRRIRARFVDGIIWVPMGRKPVITRRQADIFECYSTRAMPFEDADSGRTALSKILTELCCLVVLDDVWNVADVAAFEVIGTNGGLLVISQDLGVLEVVHCKPKKIAFLTKKESVRLLSVASGTPATRLPACAGNIITSCGGLPLALAMVGGVLKDVPGAWIEIADQLIRRDIGGIGHRFEEYPEESLSRAMEATLSHLGPENVELYRQLIVFSDGARIPDAALEVLWSSSNWKPLQVKRLLAQLISWSLLFRDDVGRLYLHEVHRAVLTGLVSDVKALNGLLLDNYLARCKQRNWATGPDDGYFFEHLMSHLVAQGRSGEALRTALSANWISVQLTKRGPAALLRDFDSLIESELTPKNLLDMARSIRDACLLSLPSAEKSPSNLIAQLLGRLSGVANPELHAFLLEAGLRREDIWMRPLNTKLHPPGTALLQVLDIPDAPIVLIPLRDGRIIGVAGHQLMLFKGTGSAEKTRVRHPRGCGRPRRHQFG